jgi:hypothetical protein
MATRRAGPRRGHAARSKIAMPSNSSLCAHLARSPVPVISRRRSWAAHQPRGQELDSGAAGSGSLATCLRMNGRGPSRRDRAAARPRAPAPRPVSASAWGGSAALQLQAVAAGDWRSRGAAVGVRVVGSADAGGCADRVPRCARRRPNRYSVLRPPRCRYGLAVPPACPRARPLVARTRQRMCERRSPFFFAAPPRPHIPTAAPPMHRLDRFLLLAAHRSSRGRRRRQVRRRRRRGCGTFPARGGWAAGC